MQWQNAQLKVVTWPIKSFAKNPGDIKLRGVSTNIPKLPSFLTGLVSNKEIFKEQGPSDSQQKFGREY